MSCPSLSEQGLESSDSLNASSLNVVTNSGFHAARLLHYQAINLMKASRGESLEKTDNSTEEHSTRKIIQGSASRGGYMKGTGLRRSIRKSAAQGRRQTEDGVMRVARLK